VMQSSESNSLLSDSNLEEMLQEIDRPDKNKAKCVAGSS
jgi:hypothetical protein